jgi:YVTN family beta-propeller protein
VQTSQKLAILPIVALVGIALTPAAARAQLRQIAFVPGDNNNTVSRVTLPDMNQTTPISVGNNPRAVAVSPDGQRLYVANYGGSANVGVYNATTGAGITTLNTLGSPHGLAITPDGSKLYVTLQSVGDVEVWDLATHTRITSVTVGAGPVPIAIDQTGTLAVTGQQWAETVSVIDVASDTVLTSIPVGGAPGGIAILPDSSLAYVAISFGTASQVVKVIDLSTYAVDTIPMASTVDDVAASRDGSRVYVLSGTNAIYTIEVDTNAVINTGTVIGGQASGLSVSPISDRLYVVGRAIPDRLHQLDADSLSTLTSHTSLLSQNASITGPFLSPLYVTGSLSFPGDAALDAQHFGAFVNLWGGVLNLTSSWTTTRTVTVIPGNGANVIHTAGATSLAATIGPGELNVQGGGVLTMATPGHTGGTTVTGRLELLQGAPTHPGTIMVVGTGALNGEGSAGSISVTWGTISPGATNSFNAARLQATNITLGGTSATYVVDLNGTGGAGIGHDQLDAGSIALGGASANLSIRVNYSPTPGTQYTIANNVTGTFAGLAEGAFVVAGGIRFHITYQGGDGNDCVLTVDRSPSVSLITSQTIGENRVMGPLSFTISDDFTPAASLGVSASSSNQALLLDTNITLDGTSGSRSITATPTALENGQTTITVLVTDGANTTTNTFTLTVTPDDPPTVTPPANQTMKRATVLGPLAFTIGDDLTDVDSLTVTALSSNTNVVTNSGLAIGGTGASRTLTITPASLLAFGQTTITLRVTDEFSQETDQTFTLDVIIDDGPTITGQATATVTRDTTLGPLPITINDDVIAPANLVLYASSSDQAVVRDQDITLGGAGTARTLTFTPAPHATGTTTIRLTVDDGFQDSDLFVAVTVTLDDPPTITGPGDISIVRGGTIAPIALTIGDDLIAPASLTLNASSSNVLLVRNEDIALSGTGGARIMTLTPQARAIGTTTITTNVFDGMQTTPHTFVLTVTKDNAPTINGPADRTVARGSVIAPIAFTIADDFIPVEELTVTAVSSNPALVRSEDIVLGGPGGGTGAARTIAITPVAGALGTATITLTVADDLSQTTHSFTLEVIEPALTYYLSEGSTGAFFDTDLLLANPNDATVPVTIELLLPDGGAPITLTRVLPATSRTTIRADEIEGLESAAFSTIVTSPTGAPIVVERTMRWDATGYGSHTEKASPSGPGLTWYFAEGSQNDFFKTYFLVANPGTEANVAHVTYVRENEPSLAIDYPIAPSSRLTIDAGAEPGLVGRAFGAVLTFDRPAMVERSMYFGMEPLFTGGHASTGAAAPATTWLLAEGATGSYFSTYVLLANPGTDPAQATVTFLPDSGVPVTKEYSLAGLQRKTLDIAAEDPALVGTAVGTQVVSDRPIVVERSQYWPNPLWHEAHNSGGVTTPGTRWGLAEGRVGGAANDATYVLLANPGADPVTATVRFLRTNGTTVTKVVPIAPTSRVTVGIAGAGSDVPELIDEAFGVTIEATHPIVVERSMYSSVNGVFWSAGTNATATPLP